MKADLKLIALALRCKSVTKIKKGVYRLYLTDNRTLVITDREIVNYFKTKGAKQ